MMLVKQQSFLYLDELYDDEYIVDFVRNIQIDSPFQQLIYEGVLSQYIHDGELVVSFTVEDYFHHVLAKVLANDTRYNSTESLLELFSTNKINGLKHALSYLLVMDVEKGDLSRLSNIIDRAEENPDVLDLCVNPIVISYQLLGVSKTLKKVLEQNTENDWLLIKKCHERLFDLELHLIRNKATLFLLKLNRFKDSKFLEIVSSGISELENKHHVQSISKIIEYEEFFNAKIYFNIGYCFEKLMNYNQSLVFFNKSLEVEDKSDLHNISLLKQKVAWAYYNLDELDKALIYNEESLKIRIELYGELNPYVAHSYNDLGLVWDAKGDVPKGIFYLEKAIDILSKVLGENILDIGTSYYNLGNLYNCEGKSSMAIHYTQKAITVYNNLIGENHINLQHFYFLMGQIEFEKNNVQIAFSYFQKSLKITEKFLNKFHPESNITFQWLGRCLYELHKFKEASSNFGYSNKIEKSCLNDAYIGLSYFQLGNVPRATKKMHDVLLSQNLESNMEAIEKIKLLSILLEKENELPDWIKKRN